MRAFIGVPIAVTVELEAMLERLRGFSELRVVAQEKLHVTLRFLGNVDANELEAIGSEIERAVVGAHPVVAKLGPLSAFPTRSRPSVVFASIDDGGLCSAIERKLDLPREDRPYHAHVTLARTKNKASRALRELLLNEATFGEVTLDRVVLFESIGGRYEPRFTRPLTGNT